MFKHIPERVGHLLGGLSKYSLKYVRMLRFNLLESVAHPFKIIWVEPGEIEFLAGEFTNNPKKYGGNFSVAYFSGSEIRSGDWDLKRKSIEDLPKCEAVFKRYDGYTWEETGIYDHMKDKIDSHGQYDGCTNKKDIKNRYNTIDEIYRDMSSNGYRLDTENDNIMVNIGRNGEILFNGNGHHRLALAKVCEVDEIPVRVLVRHKKWQKVREKIVKNDFEAEDWMYKHPDLQDLL